MWTTLPTITKYLIIPNNLLVNRQNNSQIFANFADKNNISVKGTFMKHYFCPNENCENHKYAKPGWYVKNGYYKTKHNYQRVPRYKCKCCKANFSSQTFKDTYKQKKPSLNKKIYELYSSNTSQNRLCKLLNCNIKTVVRKIRFLANKARTLHNVNMKNIEIRDIQFDEMETFEHSRKKPISIAVAVEVERFEKKGKPRFRTGRILGLVACCMPAKGHLAKVSQELYGYRRDDRYQAGIDALSKIKADSPTIMSDGKRAYPSLFKEVFPTATVKTITRKQNSGTKFDPMFSLNHACALLRHDVSRLARKSWVTTKNLSGLQDHLDIWTAYRNGYKLA